MLRRALFIAAEVLFILIIAGGIAMVFLPAGVIALGVMGLAVFVWQELR